MMSITLVDDSLELLDNFSNSNSISFLRSVTLNIFVKPKFRASLPLVRYAGDGIRLNDVEIQNWNDNIQLIGTGKSSYVVFRGSVEDPTTTTALALFPTDAENFVTNDAMKGHMLDFWRRSQRRFMLHPTMKPEHCFKLSDLSPANNLQLLSSEETNRRGDLTVMVAAIIPVPENCVSSITPRGFLRVWDGTGPPISDPLPLDSAEAIESIRSGDPPSSTLIVIADIVEKLQNLRQNPDLCPPKALSGRVANVAIWEQEHWQLVFEKVIKVGLFIRLRNVQDRNMGNINVRCLHVHTKSSLTPLPSLNFEVMHLLEEHNNRLLRNEPINPKSGILPLSPNEMLGLSNDRWRQHQTMQNSPTLQSAPLSNNISSVFIGLVKVSRMIPILTIESDQVWEVICPMKTNGLVKIERFYRFGLRLDVLSSAESLDVIVFEDVVIEDSSPGAVLFGMSATDAYNNRRTALRIFHSNLQADRLCKVKITSVVSDGEKYFLLNSLEAAV